MTATLLRRIDRRGHADPTAELPLVAVDDTAPTEAVRAILDDVRRHGDAAVASYTARFDGVDLPDARVADADLVGALDRLDPALADALVTARDAIAAFHDAEAARPHSHTEGGISIRSIPQPVDRAGLYVPGGLAAYPSTVLMTALPARSAGVTDIAMCAPPAPDGTLPHTVLAAAHLAGITEVHRIGGAQAIAALAYGTETVRPVDVIAGPGNVYVATAQREVAGRVRIAAAFAGPSEIVVVADRAVPSTSVAVDLVLQAEHGPGGRAWLITWDESVADAVEADVAAIVDASPRRDETLATLRADGYTVLVDGPTEAAAVANRVAPEHLQVMCTDPDAVVADVRHAGAVFVGPWAPASIGDYVAGPSHVLPTAGTARFAGALTVDDFQKRMHVIDVSRDGFERVRPAVAALATAEGLWAHAASVDRRVEWAESGVS